MTSGLDYNVDQMSEMFLKLSCQTIYKWNSSGIVCKFSQRTYPKISYQDYLKRLWYHSDCSLQCFVIVLIYLERFTINNPDLWLDDASIYTITLVMLVIAVKFLDDHKHSNKYFANLGGISLRLLNEMELELLQLMEFKLFVKEDELFRYMKYFI